MQDLSTWHQTTLAQIETQLTQSLVTNKKCQTLLSAMRYSTLDGGKRIRPLFTVASGNLSKAELKNTLIIGAAIEMIHCFSLIHDDLPIMDNDDLRRGRPTNHKVFGDAVALLAGDALHALCFELLSAANLNISDKHKLQIIQLIAKAIGIDGMVCGQTIDWLSTGQAITLNQLQEMHFSKTGALLRAAILAGYLAGTNFELAQYQQIDFIAQKIGLLFQIVDDIIDATEDTQTLGKTANKDILQDKATYVTVLGLVKAKQAALALHQETITLIQQQQHSQQLLFLANNVYYRNN